MLELQEQRWRQLARFALKHSRYYQRIAQERNLDPETVRPEDFPVLTKTLIEKHFDEIVTDPRLTLKEVERFVAAGDPQARLFSRYLVLKTSGTSGRPGFFVASSEDVLAGVAPSVARGPLTKRRFPKRIAMVGFPSSFAGSSQSMSFCHRIWLARRLVRYRAISIEQPFEDVLRELQEFQPHILSGYAKLLLLVADAQRAGRLRLQLDSVESGGETLLETDRRYLKETFSCPVNNHYGSTEGFSMGISRDGTDFLELHEDHLIFEILEEETRITNLNNYTMPLIRYRIRDVLGPRPLDEARPFRRVEPIIGRADEIPYFTTTDQNRITVHPLAFDPLMPEGVKSFYMVSEEVNSVAFHIFLDDKSRERSDEVLNSVRQVLKSFFAEKGLSNLRLEVVLEKDYGINSNSGKTTFWRHQVPPGGAAD